MSSVESDETLVSRASWAPVNTSSRHFNFVWRNKQLITSRALFGNCVLLAAGLAWVATAVVIFKFAPPGLPWFALFAALVPGVLLCGYACFRLVLRQVMLAKFFVAPYKHKLGLYPYRAMQALYRAYLGGSHDGWVESRRCFDEVMVTALALHERFPQVPIFEDPASFSGVFAQYPVLLQPDDVVAGAYEVLGKDDLLLAEFLGVYDGFYHGALWLDSVS